MGAVRARPGGRRPEPSLSWQLARRPSRLSVSVVPALVRGDRQLGVLDGLAVVVGLIASVIEFVADEQMRRFVRVKTPGAVMDRGLWRFSRHPNYFGGILFWWSLWVFAVAADPAWWWTVIGPVAMVA